MPTIEFKQAVGRVHFDAGMTGDGKVIRKSKTYRYIVENVTPANLHTALTQLAQLSSYTFTGAEKIETSELYN